MKNIIRISLLCAVLSSSGCATWHKLRDRIDDWAGYDPPQQSEPEPSEPEPPKPPDERVAIVLDYSQPWTLTLTGDFRVNDHGRYVQTGTLRDGIDIFRWAGCLTLRLYDRRIIFTEALQGSISSPAPPDHWAMTIPQHSTANWSGTLQIVYDPQGLATMIRNGEQIGQWRFRIDNMPPVRRWLYLRGFSGGVKLK